MHNFIITVQEPRLKKYKQSLELILQNYYSVCSSVAGSLKRLLTPHMESVLHYLQPGLSTLNWSSMNIDAYLHQVHSATDRLKDIVDNINQVIKDGVETKIKEIQHIILFDPTLAYSKVWTVDKFVESEGRAIKGQSKVLYDLIKDVENALQVMINAFTAISTTFSHCKLSSSFFLVFSPSVVFCSVLFVYICILLE